MLKDRGQEYCIPLFVETATVLYARHFDVEATRSGRTRKRLCHLDPAHRPPLTAGAHEEFASPAAQVEQPARPSQYLRCTPR
jgi:hypothetical protein